jgi:hypothetical protein
MGAAYLCYNLKVLGVDVPGGMKKEYWAVPLEQLLRIPAGLSDDHAALIEPLAVATHDVNRAAVKPATRSWCSAVAPSAPSSPWWPAIAAATSWSRRSIASATHWTRLSCHRFRANEVRLLLGVIAYNLGNLLRRLALPLTIQSWSLTSLQQRLSSRPGAPHPACAILHPPACRKPLDAAPVSADSRAHRATRVAPHLIAAGTSKRRAGGAMSNQRGCL